MTSVASATFSNPAFRPYRPKFIAALNGIGRLLEAFGLRASLDAASLIAAARKKTGLQDFGDESFRSGLEILTRSLDTEAHLHPVGRLIMRQRLIGLLAVRLKAQQLFALGILKSASSRSRRRWSSPACSAPARPCCIACWPPTRNCARCAPSKR